MAVRCIISVIIVQTVPPNFFSASDPIYHLDRCDCTAQLGSTVQISTTARARQHFSRHSGEKEGGGRNCVRLAEEIFPLLVVCVCVCVAWSSIHVFSPFLLSMVWTTWSSTLSLFLLTTTPCFISGENHQIGISVRNHDLLSQHKKKKGGATLKSQWARAKKSEREYREGFFLFFFSSKVSFFLFCCISFFATFFPPSLPLWMRV